MNAIDNSIRATVTLNNNISMPRFGFGVYKLGTGDEAVAAITEALRLGYRLIDTASVYGNEREVGRALKQTNVPRSEIFVTTKVWNNERSTPEAVREALAASLERLGQKYVDLYMIHWPVMQQGRSLDPETWTVLEELYRAGKARAIGVCNFSPWHLRQLEKTAAVTPMVNQVEFNPLCTNDETFLYCQEADIPVQAYSPLARAGELFASPVIRSLAEKYGKTPAQVVLRWHWQKGTLPIPKSGTPARIRENMEFFDFSLNEEEMDGITALNRDQCTGGSKFMFDGQHSVLQ